MRSKLILMAVVTCAPSWAVAFGDLDCISTEVCIGTTCETTVAPFSITFQWDESTAQITLPIEPGTVDLMQSPTAPAGQPGALAFGRDGDARSTGLILTYGADAITATITNSAAPATTYSATCAQAQAA